ncbi:MAG: efflux RND transporter periplasmic adaptor subunit [Candidatus Moranbacteria bacterium]|nr:efflux RND transporter periplasmic adaptor subunit [Candidatus Moranbacteria bacterium]
MRKISPKQKYCLAGVAIMVAVSAFLFSKTHGAKQATPAIQPVKIFIAKEADKSMPLEISGFVRGEDRADVAPAASGKILRIFKHEGQSVKKGEVLATIDANVSDAQVAAASASVDALQKTVDDSKKYYDQLVDQTKNDSNSTDESVKSSKRARDLQIQAAKDQLVAAQGALGIAQASKNNSTVVAPFSGTITAVFGREGGFANFSLPLVSISTQNSFEIETYVSATDGRSIAVGTIATMQTSDGRPVSGIVTNVSAGGDTQSLKTLVRIHIDNTSDSVYLGDFLHGEILTARIEKTVSIPRNAVVSRGGDRVVFVLDEDNIAKEQAIKTGSENDGMIDVTEGINPDQKIVVEGQQYLTNGSTTKPYESN